MIRDWRIIELKKYILSVLNLIDVICTRIRKFDCIFASDGTR